MVWTAGAVGGGWLRKEIRFHDEKSPTLSLVMLVTGVMEPDSEKPDTGDPFVRFDEG